MSHISSVQKFAGTFVDHSTAGARSLVVGRWELKGDGIGIVEKVEKCSALRCAVLDGAKGGIERSQWPKAFLIGGPLEASGT
jgi:hypothetical protein